MTADEIKHALAARSKLRTLDPASAALIIVGLFMASADVGMACAEAVQDRANDLPGGVSLDLALVDSTLAYLADARLCSRSGDDYYLDYKARGEIALWGAGGWLGKMLSVDGAVELVAGK